MIVGTCDFSLKDDQGHPLTGLPFTGETTVNEDCSAAVVMDFASRPVKSTFQLQLHRNKKSFVGRWENNLGALGTTNGVKQ